MKMQDNHVFELCIIGNGMIGSSAAAHASKKLKSDLLLIGPSEKTVFSVRGDVYGAHYDNGRISKIGERDAIWSFLSAASMRKYREIEKMSGIQFYDDIGVIFFGDEPRVKRIISLLEAYNCGRFLTKAQTKSRFPYFNIPKNMSVIFEETGGIINPRKLIEAQCVIAKKNGCQIMDDIVRKVIKDSTSSEKDIYSVETDGGKVILARKILLATGCYSNNRSLIPGVRRMPFRPTTQTVAMLEVSQKDLARFRKMPCVSASATNDTLAHYFLPPIQYSDGKYYIKVGHWSDFEEPRETSDDIQEWWKTNGFPEGVEALKKTCLKIVKDFDPVSVRSDRCLTTVTDDGGLIIDHVLPNYVVAIGGNGQGAKSSVEIGRIAADLVIHDKWLSVLPESHFKLSRPTLQTKAKL